jgi:hypothetical protein
MPQRTIRLLHVEVDEIQRHILQHHLAVIDESQFNVQFADSEESALEIFDRGVEIVILD